MNENILLRLIEIYLEDLCGRGRTTPLNYQEVDFFKKIWALQKDIKEILQVKYPKLKKAEIISGFPGVGKTHTTNNNKDLKILDSDSINFSWAGYERNPEFPKNYIQHIQKNMYSYDIIFVSSHKEVRDALKENEISFTLVYPHKSLKEEYIERFRARGSNEVFIKKIDDNWDSWLTEIKEFSHHTFMSDNIDFCELCGKNKFLNIKRDIMAFKEER